MPLNIGDYADIAAMLSAFCDVVSLGREQFEAIYERYRAAPNAIERGAILKSTYSDEEIQSIRDNIDHCRKQFIETGNGDQRRRCLCFTLKQVKLGDGRFPFEEWEDAYQRLC